MTRHKVDLTFKGDVLSLLLELEGREVDMHFDIGSSEWKRIAQIEVDGELNVFLHAQGINGTEWEFTMKVDGEGPHKATGTIAKGFSRHEADLTLPLNGGDE